MKKYQVLEWAAVCGFVLLAFTGIFFLNNRVKQAEFVFDYGETIPTNTAYYFTNAREDEVLDPALFQFNGLGVFQVPVTLDNHEHVITIRIVDKRAPQITFVGTEIDRSQTADWHSIIEVEDRSEVTVSFSLDINTVSVGTHELTVTAKDAYGNVHQAKEYVTVNDSSVQSTFKRKYSYTHNSLEEIVAEYMKERGLTEESLSLYYVDQRTGEQVVKQADRTFAANVGYAVPLAMYAQDLLNSNSIKPDEKLLVCSTCYPDETTLRHYPYALGEKVPIKELLDLMITEYSDVSAMVLYNHSGGWETVVPELQKYATTADGITVNQEVSIRYLQEVMQTLRKQTADYPDLMNWLQHDGHLKYLRKYMHDVPVAHQPARQGAWVIDTGIVQSESPYVLTVAVQNEQEGENIIGELSLIVYYYHMRDQLSALP